jgi:ribose/xylose/arabinose/galactoside ABC-type transport system permease subunit
MTILITRAAPNALPLSMAAFVVILAVLEPAFLSGSNLIGILRAVSLVGIMALGMTFVIMTGGIDLSVGPVSAIAGLVAYFTLVAGYGLVMALLAGAGTGLLIGVLNGLLVASLGLPAIIVTLGSLSIVRGSALLLGGPDLHGIRDQAAYSFIGSGAVYGIPVPVLIFLVLAGLAWFLQSRTPFGTLVAAVGDNERAAWLSGLNVTAVKAATYGLCALLAAVAGMIQSSQVHTASATYGKFGTELDVIAAVVLGGTQLSGGAGSVARTLLGVLFLGILNNGMNILNLSIDIQLIAKGAIIALALSLAARRAG